MKQNDLVLLDCTLRDGGYINKWNWGFHDAKAIIQALVKAKIDVIEVGFLRDVEGYDPDITVCNRIEELNRLLPENIGQTMFSAMAMRSSYDIHKLSPYSGSGIEMIRVTAHDYDIEEGIDFSREVKEKGYKLSINPINIMGYSDDKILWIIDQINRIHPYQFSIVDTFGSMKRRDLDRIVGLVDHNLDRDIRVALHLHENMSLSYSLAQDYVDKHLNRPVAIDGSLMGMGRIPGNLPIELICDYLNEYAYKSYDIDYLMDAIQDYVAPIKGTPEWGYTPAFFLSARYNLHRNYAEHFLNKGDLTNRDINRILARISINKKTVFDVQYANELYKEYQSNIIDDTSDRKALETKLKNMKILVAAPGTSISKYEEIVNEYIKIENPIVISVNFVPQNTKVDYAFFSNSKRFHTIEHFPCQIIITSNIHYENADYLIDYNALSLAFEHGSNSLVMLLKLLHDIGVERVSIAGADGYSLEKENYHESVTGKSIHRDYKYNEAIKQALRRIGIKLNFITPSMYDDKKQ